MAKKQVGTKIKKWLEQETLTVNLTTPKGFEFVLQAEEPKANIPYTISQPGVLDVIGISAQINSPKEVTDIFKQVKEDLKTELIQSMHRELLKIVHDHVIDKDLKNITVTERIYLENLTRQNFMNSHTNVRNAYLYLISVLRGHFAGLKNPQTTAGYTMYH